MFQMFEKKIELCNKKNWCQWTQSRSSQITNRTIFLIKNYFLNYFFYIYLHLVRLFWNQVLTWASVIFKALASADLSADARYFCRWNLFSNSTIWSLEKEVRGFLRFGGVLVWYGWPTRRAAATNYTNLIIYSYI